MARQHHVKFFSLVCVVVSYLLPYTYLHSKYFTYSYFIATRRGSAPIKREIVISTIRSIVRYAPASTLQSHRPFPMPISMKAVHTRRWPKQRSDGAWYKSIVECYSPCQADWVHRGYQHLTKRITFLYIFRSSRERDQRWVGGVVIFARIVHSRAS